MADEYSLSWKRSLYEDSMQQPLKYRADSLVLDIEASLLGLKNLEGTYCQDLNRQVRLHVLIEKISTQISIFKEILNLPRSQALSKNHLPSSREILILSLDDM
jgi:hypothetical protein